jgi:hypothetical protein
MSITFSSHNIQSTRPNIFIPINNKMKFTSSLVALCILQGASAFVFQAPAQAGSALKSSDVSYFEKGTGSSYAPVKTSSRGGDMNLVKNVWDTLTPTTVQGGSLRTWSFQTPEVKRVQVFLKTEGRPLNADIDLWQGPDNTPEKMRVYIEDGSARSFNAVIETPRGHNAVAIRNTGQLEFPLEGCVEAGMDDIPVTQRFSDQSIPKVIQGGAIKTYPFSAYSENVKVLLKTDGRPLNARIELLQGPNNNKQVVEVYTEDGLERPFFIVLETPGVNNVVRIVNTAPVEFPMTAVVEAYPLEPSNINDDTISRPSPAWETGGYFFGR